MSTKPYKIAVIGDADVGKTSFIKRFVYNEFSNDAICTIGIDICKKNLVLNGETIEIDIWDTAGQERFNTVTSSFYRDLDGIFIAYDITDRESFQRVSQWIQECNRYCWGERKLILIGMKSDMEVKRVVSFDEARKFATSERMAFIEASAKTNHNIYHAFETMVRYIKENIVLDSVKSRPSSVSICISHTKKKKQLTQRCC